MLLNPQTAGEQKLTAGGPKDGVGEEAAELAGWKNGEGLKGFEAMKKPCERGAGTDYLALWGLWRVGGGERGSGPGLCPRRGVGGGVWEGIGLVRGLGILNFECLFAS